MGEAAGGDSVVPGFCTALYLCGCSGPAPSGEASSSEGWLAGALAVSAASSRGTSTADEEPVLHTKSKDDGWLLGTTANNTKVHVTRCTGDCWPRALPGRSPRDPDAENNAHLRMYPVHPLLLKAASSAVCPRGRR